MISKSGKYAMRAVVYIASKATSGRKIGIKEIAEEIEAPPAFTAKILQILKKSEIISSLKGPTGGFFCNQDQLNLAVIEIIDAIDGLAAFNDCVMGLHKCSSSHPCPMHNEYAKTRDSMLESFQNVTIHHLADNLLDGSSFLKNL